MTILIVVLQFLAAIAALASIPLFFAFRWPKAAMWGLKVYVSALSPVFAFLGAVTILVGAFSGSLLIILPGAYVFLIYLIHIICVTRPPHAAGSFEQAFGPHWRESILPQQKTYFLPRRTTLRLPAVPAPRLEQNLSFATLPGTGRQLLCDIWQPPQNVSPSRLAFIYMHGSAFYMLDKDYGTRPFFRHLAAQGHVIMDVAYRLAPETDIMGMIHDVKRAVAWMKEHAADYGIEPERIVVGGGSAGGHLALMTAYTASDPQFAPGELTGEDLSVCAVVSLYGPTDLAALYYHTNQHLAPRSVPIRRKKTTAARVSRWILKSAGKDYHRLGLDKDFEKTGALAPILGGHPDECPERYALLSPLTHVHTACPPTLLIHGQHDIMAPVTTTRSLYVRLLQYKIPAVLHILPQTDHGFDLLLPHIAPSAHNALYDVERFLALMTVRKGTIESKAPLASNSLASGSTRL